MGFKRIDPDELRHLHDTVGLSPIKIATRLGVQKTSVYAALERNNITRREPTGPRTRPPLHEIASKDDIETLLANGNTVIDIAAHYDYTADTIYNLLKRYGLKPPGPGQRSFRTTDHLDPKEVRRIYKRNTLKDTAAHFDISDTAMRTFMAHNKIKIRNPNANLANIDPAQVQQRNRAGESIAGLARSYGCSTTYIRKCLGLDGHTPPQYPPSV